MSLPHLRTSASGLNAAVMILMGLAVLPTVFMVLSTVYLLSREVWRTL